LLVYENYRYVILDTIKNEAKFGKLKGGVKEDECTLCQTYCFWVCRAHDTNNWVYVDNKKIQTWDHNKQENADFSSHELPGLSQQFLHTFCWLQWLPAEGERPERCLCAYPVSEKEVQLVVVKKGEAPVEIGKASVGNVNLLHQHGNEMYIGNQYEEGDVQKIFVLSETEVKEWSVQSKYQDQRQHFIQCGFISKETMFFFFNHTGEANPYVSVALLDTKDAENKTEFKEGTNMHFVALRDDKEKTYCSDYFCLANRTLKTLTLVNAAEEFVTYAFSFKDGKWSQNETIEPTKPSKHEYQFGNNVEDFDICKRSLMITQVVDESNSLWVKSFKANESRCMYMWLLVAAKKKHEWTISDDYLRDILEHL